MENASPTPTQALRAQWLTLAHALILSDKPLAVTVDWLERHPDYDANTFWTAPGRGGHPFLPELFLQKHHEDYVIPKFLPILKKLAPPEALIAQFNQAGDDGRVLLHLMWEDRQKKARSDRNTHYSSRPEDTVSSQWVGVLDATDPKFWTFLDKAEDAPGAGLRRTLMDILSMSPSEPSADMANGAMERLAKVYPAAPPKVLPEDSPWRGALTAAQVDALASLGHRLDEPVKVGVMEVPAWEWLSMQHTRSGGRTELGRAVLALAEKQGLSETIESWREKNNAWSAARTAANLPTWQALSPTDRRASTGYVAAVLKFANQDGSPCFDRYGRSPMDYLLNHRSDLFDLFAGRAMRMPTADFQAKFMQPDRAGVPAILRYFQRIPEGSMSVFKSLMEAHGCWTEPAQLLIERGGLFAWERTMSGWSSAQDRGSDEFPVARLASSLKDPAVLFGSIEQQQATCRWWEASISRWSGMTAWFNKTSPWQASSQTLFSLPVKEQFPRIAARQIQLFLANGASDSWKEQMDPGLWSTLQVASCAIATGLEQKSSQSWFSGLSKYSHELANHPPKVVSQYSYSRESSPADKWGVTLSRNPPQSPTPALLEALSGPSGEAVLAALDRSADLPGRHWSWTHNPEVRESWATWHKRAKLMLSVASPDRADSRPRM